MLSYKKPLIDKFFEPLITPFKHVNPNALTLLGSIPSILFFVFIVNHWYLAAVLAFLGTAFDMFDGMIARKYNKVTAFGGLLDSTFDRVSDFLMISAFAFGGIVHWKIAAPLLLVSFLISYVRTRSEAASHEVSFAVGIIERTERLIFVILGLIIYLFFPNIAIEGFNLAELVFLILLVLSVYTVYQRIAFAYKKL